MNKKIKTGDLIFYAGDFYTVEWIDDSGVTNLIGIKDTSGIIKVISFSEKNYIKS